MTEAGRGTPAAARSSTSPRISAGDLVSSSSTSCECGTDNNRRFSALRFASDDIPGQPPGSTGASGVDVRRPAVQHRPGRTRPMSVQPLAAVRVSTGERVRIQLTDGRERGLRVLGLHSQQNSKRPGAERRTAANVRRLSLGRRDRGGAPVRSPRLGLSRAAFQGCSRRCCEPSSVRATTLARWPGCRVRVPRGRESGARGP